MIGVLFKYQHHIIVNSCPQQRDGACWIVIRKLNSHIIFEPLNAFWLAKIYLDISEIVLKSMHTAKLSAAAESRPRLDIIESYAVLLERWNLFWHIRKFLVKRAFYSYNTIMLYQIFSFNKIVEQVKNFNYWWCIIWNLLLTGFHDVIHGLYHLLEKFLSYFIRFVG